MFPSIWASQDFWDTQCIPYSWRSVSIYVAHTDTWERFAYDKFFPFQGGSIDRSGGENFKPARRPEEFVSSSNVEMTLTTEFVIQTWMIPWTFVVLRRRVGGMNFGTRSEVNTLDWFESCRNHWGLACCTPIAAFFSHIRSRPMMKRYSNLAPMQLGAWWWRTLLIHKQRLIKDWTFMLIPKKFQKKSSEDLRRFFTRDWRVLECFFGFQRGHWCSSTAEPLELQGLKADGSLNWDLSEILSIDLCRYLIDMVASFKMMGVCRSN